MTLISRAYWTTLRDRDPHPSPADDRVWGVAYRIEPGHVDEVKEYLDIREINGYTIHYTPFHPATSSSSADETESREQQQQQPIRTLVYIGTPDNDQFVGPVQDPQALAEHIYASRGPSGLNRDYLFGLERSLAELSPESGDEHVRDLAARVRAVAAREEGGKAREGGEGGGEVEKEKVVVDRDVRREEHEHPHNFRRRESVDEVEETEKTTA